MIVGFDFGTTNSLVSVVVGDRVIDVLDSEGRPHPSVVRYEGEDVVVGHDARRALEDVGLGVHGNTVRSPKFYLGDEIISVGGVERSPIDVVAEVIHHVRDQSLQSPQRNVLGDLDRAVVTIPISMNGPRRGALREAFAQAGISIAQFVHEPLAALYGHLRGSSDSEEAIRSLSRRYVLVVDWGGGTLDLTLCKVERGRILQLRNGGTDLVGGDQFDKVIRDEVVLRFSLKAGIKESDRPDLDARLRLLQDAERNKIALSERAQVTFYRPSYFPESGSTLEYPLGRQELDEICRPLVAAGLREIEALLDAAGLSPAQISLCLVAGGMAAMPNIRSRLHAMFGPERVIVPPNSATLVSQGAAWIAHDAQRLVLAKQVELELARGSRMTLLRAGTPMPADGELKQTAVHLYCTDPTDGLAKFPIAVPAELREHPQASDARTSLGLLSIRVDPTAPPLVERLDLKVTLDDDLILNVKASSSQGGDSSEASFFDLEFGIGLPGNAAAAPSDPEDVDAAAPSRGLVVRTNIAKDQNPDSIPGEVLYVHRRHAFARLPGPDRATDQQRLEHLYYQPCAVCRRKWGDPACRCASVA